LLRKNSSDSRVACKNSSYDEFRSPQEFRDANPPRSEASKNPQINKHPLREQLQNILKTIKDNENYVVPVFDLTIQILNAEKGIILVDKQMNELSLLDKN
jgi:hypothetical protein